MSRLERAGAVPPAFTEIAPPTTPYTPITSFGTGEQFGQAVQSMIPWVQYSQSLVDQFKTMRKFLKDNGDVLNAMSVSGTNLQFRGDLEIKGACTFDTKLISANTLTTKTDFGCGGIAQAILRGDGRCIRVHDKGIGGSVQINRNGGTALKGL